MLRAKCHRKTPSRAAQSVINDEYKSGGETTMGTFYGLKKLAGEAVTKASEGLEAAESVAGRAGMTKKNGEILR